MRKKISLDLEPQKKEPRLEDLDPTELIERSEQHQFGNRADYYHKRGTSLEVLDSRVFALDSLYFRGKKVLDLGCHCGIVTLQIAKTFRPRYIKGIDIDFRLINKAVTHWAAEEKIAALQKQHAEEQLLLKEKLAGFKAFPKAILEIDKGLRELVFHEPDSRKMDEEFEVEYPHNVSFEITNALDLDEAREKKQYDCVVCFSLTKWVHLNYGDEGIKKLFSKIKSVLAPQGYLFLEVQKYKTYSKKAKEFARFRQVLPTIRLLPDMFEEYLCKKLGFVREEVVASKNQEAFKRDITIFRLK